MSGSVGITAVVLLVIVAGLLVTLILRQGRGAGGVPSRQLLLGQERSERLLREEMERGREEIAHSGLQVRQEVAGVG